MTQTEILTEAVLAGFMLHTGYGQGINKQMPVSDTATLLDFANRCIQAAVLAEPVNPELNWGDNKFMPHEQPVKQEPFMCEPVPPVSEDGWTDWVSPIPTGYLMQCCDCGLIHEVDSRVAKYEPMPSEEFEVVDDPDMQCQWRMRRRDDLSSPVNQKRRELTHDQYLALAKDADILTAHEYCHLDELEMKKAWVVEYGKLVYAKAWLDGYESDEPLKQEPVALSEIRRIAAEYVESDSHVDSGNLFWALCGALQYIDAELKFNAPVDAKAIRARGEK